MHVCSNDLTALHAPASHLSIFHQLGAQPWQNPAREGALNVTCSDRSRLCLRQHCRCRHQRASGPQYQMLSKRRPFEPKGNGLGTSI